MSAGLQVHHHHLSSSLLSSLLSSSLIFVITYLHHYYHHYYHQYHHNHLSLLSLITIIITYYYHHLSLSQLFGSADAGEAGLCLYTFGAIPLFVLCKPWVLYKTLLVESEWWQGLSMGTMGRDDGISSSRRDRPGGRASLGRGPQWFPSGIYIWKMIYGEVMQRIAWIDSNNRLKPVKHYRVQQQHEDGSSHHQDGSSHHLPNDHRMDGDHVPIIEDRSASSSSTSSSASCFGQLQGPLLGSGYR